MLSPEISFLASAQPSSSPIDCKRAFASAIFFTRRVIAVYRLAIILRLLLLARLRYTKLLTGEELHAVGVQRK